MFFNKQPYVIRKIDYSRPFVVLNLKTYNESAGINAIKLASIAERVQSKTNVNIIICPRHLDLKDIASRFKIPVYAQHCDNADIGKSTGSVIPKQLLDINVHGSLLNHSEKPLSIKEISATVLKMKELDMTSIVCAPSNTEVKKISSMKLVKPNFIAVEPPELIGGETSVSHAKPEVITKSVKACNGIPLLVGAGIKDNQDMKVALNLGAKGVLLSSHFVLSLDPEKFLLELVRDV